MIAIKKYPKAIPIKVKTYPIAPGWNENEGKEDEERHQEKVDQTRRERDSAGKESHT